MEVVISRLMITVIVCLMAPFIVQMVRHHHQLNRVVKIMQLIAICHQLDVVAVMFRVRTTVNRFV